MEVFSCMILEYPTDSSLPFLFVLRERKRVIFSLLPRGKVEENEFEITRILSFIYYRDPPTIRRRLTRYVTENDIFLFLFFNLFTLLF